MMFYNSVHISSVGCCVVCRFCVDFLHHPACLFNVTKLFISQFLLADWLEQCAHHVQMDTAFYVGRR